MAFAGGRKNARSFPVEIDRLGAERAAEKLTENIGTESFRAGGIGAQVVTAGGQHQLGAAFGADGRQGWTIDINHQGVSALPHAAPDGAASGLVIVGRPYVWDVRDARPVVWRQKFVFRRQTKSNETPERTMRIRAVPTGSWPNCHRP